MPPPVSTWPFGGGSPAQMIGRRQGSIVDIPVAIDSNGMILFNIGGGTGSPPSSQWPFLGIPTQMFGRVQGTTTDIPLAVDVNGQVIGSISGGTITGNTLIVGTLTVQNNTAAAFSVGRQGATNPVLQAGSTSASAVTGWQFFGGAAGAGATQTVISSATNEQGSINARNAGSLGIQDSATGLLTLGFGGGAVNIATTTGGGGPVQIGNGLAGQTVGITGITTITGAMSIIGTTNINVSNNANVSICTGSSSGSVDIGTTLGLVSITSAGSPLWRFAAGSGNALRFWDGTNVQLTLDFATPLLITRGGITLNSGQLTKPGGTLLVTSSALTDGSAAQIATMTNGPTAGNPTKWIPINDNGTTRYIPAW